MVLCFSPVGGVLRKRGRKFPAITNCTCINWFHEWPEEALISVSVRFLSENKNVPEELLKPIGEFMANVHNSTFILLRNAFLLGQFIPHHFSTVIYFLLF